MLREWRCLSDHSGVCDRVDLEVQALDQLLGMEPSAVVRAHYAVSPRHQPPRPCPPTHALLCSRRCRRGMPVCRACAHSARS